MELQRRQYQPIACVGGRYTTLSPGTRFRRFFQPVGCLMGFHQPPPQRPEAGPIVAPCRCCNKVVYFYGSVRPGSGSYPSLALTDFPKVLGSFPALPR